jgi:chaperonin GroEL (HSP60 family)
MSHDTADGDAESDIEDPSTAILTAADALASAVRTTLGPNGMDKMMIGNSGTVIVTNDGASIIDRMDIDDAVGQVVQRVAGAQDHAVGDGTTTTLLLTGELVGAATELCEDGLHPTTVVDGFTRAARDASRHLREYGAPIAGRDDAHLTHVAETAVTGRWDDDATERFAALTLDALWAVDFDSSRLTLRSYAGGELRDSEHVDGVLVDMETSSTSVETVTPTGVRSFSDPTIAMVDGEVGIEDPDSVGRVELETPDQAREFQAHERRVRDRAVGAVVETGADVLFCQKSIDGTIRNRLFGHGVLPVERTRRDEFDVIAGATGSSPVRSVVDLQPADTGSVGSVDRRTVGTTETLVLRDCDGERRSSLLLRGGTPHVADEVRRIVSDCIDVVRLALEDGHVVPGGGALAVALSADLRATGRRVPDRSQLAIEAVADALEAVPRALARNAGSDPIDTLVELRRRHDAGDHSIGVRADGRLRDMTAAGVMEPAAVFDGALRRAVDVTSLLLRIDDIVSKPGAAATETRSRSEHSHGEQDSGGYPWAVGH